MSVDSVTIRVASVVPATLTHPAVVYDSEGVPHDLRDDCLVTIGGQPVTSIPELVRWVEWRDDPRATLTVDPGRYDRVVAADFF